MINTQDQEALFKLISDYLEIDIECIAIGGTAMMFSGYKTTTKDIDLIFKDETDRDFFISAIKSLGYKEKSMRGIYDKKREGSLGKPLMFTRGDERFDLFVENVFGFSLDISKMVERRDFLGEQQLIIYILPPEYLVLLKSLTDRKRDFEDIETILEFEKNLDWDLIVNEAIKPRKTNDWILLDLEKTIKELKKKYFIKNEVLKHIYEAEDKFH